MDVYQQHEPYLPNASMMGGIGLESAANGEQAGDLAAWLRGLGDHPSDEYGSDVQRDELYDETDGSSTAIGGDTGAGEDSGVNSVDTEGTDTDTDTEGTAHADAG